ncbi:MAG: glycoside hydrolase family 97 protein [Planctomycetota bacterium]|nr:glycoside hydrolase family 97 protein [Planctomycetaceae bacterium]MDQ3329769.1 glycoside hydrolase family 97 protein [Planctomycetota bacterium]
MYAPHRYAAFCACLTLCPSVIAEEPQQLASPDGRLKVAVSVDDDAPTFVVRRDKQTVTSGRLGLSFAPSGSLQDGMKIVDTARRSHDGTYAIPVGKTSQARDHYNELIVALEETATSQRRIDIIFRAFDDGIAFRYSVPKQDALTDVVLTDELTSLSFEGDPTAHVLPLNSYTTPYEKYYETKPVSKIAASDLVGLPLLMRASDDLWIAVTEANLANYAGMYLAGDEKSSGKLVSKLSPLPGRNDGAKVIGKTPFVSPWRILMIADDPGRLLESNLVFNLSEPSKIADPSWIKPGKTTFPWWNGYVVGDVDFEPGVNTATMKHYIDFCAEEGIPYHSLDGLDIAWYGGPIHPNGPTDVTTADPAIDMPELLRYAQEKGVRLRLWMHWEALRPRIDEAFATYEEWGIEGVMVDFMDRDDQEMVAFYHEMAEKAAKHHLTLTLHGAYKPTGMERTWPNVLSYEAALNQEYNKWQPKGVKGTPPDHNLDIAFVRMLAGPLDYHQGGMRSVLPEDYQWRDKAPPVQGTRGHQLGMYVVYQNHMSMIADYPNALRGQDGLDFIAEVPANWDETRVLLAEYGKCLVIARRKGENWYVGGMAAEACELSLELDFLKDGDYDAKLYLDDPAKGPTALATRKESVKADETLKTAMPESGGFAAIMKPAVE